MIRLRKYGFLDIGRLTLYTRTRFTESGFGISVSNHDWGLGIFSLSIYTPIIIFVMTFPFCKKGIEKQDKDKDKFGW